MDRRDLKRGKKSGEEVVELDAKQLLSVVDKAILAIRDQLEREGGKGSIADLLKLLTLRKELDGDKPEAVVARWVDECDHWND